MLNQYTASLFVDGTDVKFTAILWSKEKRYAIELDMDYGGRDLPIKRKTQASKKEQLSQIYIKDDVSDDDEDSEVDSPECWKFWRESSKPPTIPLSDYTKRPSLYGQNGAYLLIVIGMTIFVLFVNHYNAKQVDRIKEEFGMDSTAVAPELWWQHSLLYNLVVRSFKDTNGDGIGDLKGTLKVVV